MMVSKEEIVDAIYRRRGFFLRVIGVSFSNISKDEKEELFQESILKFISLDIKFDNVEKGLIYFRKLFMSEIVNENRRRIRNRLLSLSHLRGSDVQANFLENVIPVSDGGPDELLEKSAKENLEEEILKKVKKALNSLPEIQKRLIVDYFLSDRKESFKNIAIKHSLDYGFAYKSLRKGLVSIRKSVFPQLLIFILFYFLRNL